MAGTHWIDDPAELSRRLACCSDRAGLDRVGLDTEFIRERTYWPQLALVQVSTGEDILLVDMLVPGMPAALASLLRDASVSKIMHSASEDLVALQHACGCVPKPLFDTQIAAALCGVGAGMGYQRLVSDLLGIAVDKGETRSDWMRRPLSPQQLDYAADDVRHLFALHDQLDARLETLGRGDWLREDCARLVDAADAGGEDPWPHLALRAAQFLDADAQRRLLRLLRWRETQARAGDRPRNWILDGELAVLLAKNPPADADALRRLLESRPKSPLRLSNAIWDALSTPLADEATMPLARDDEGDRKTLRRLQDAVAERSRELALPDGVLASRRWLQALLEQKQWPPMLAGWRRGQLEPVLAPLLAADAGKPATA
ncbi:ribonuclease D [Pseudoluteimonas lycopersici]|uniref:Ribonuclease D n=1 Tax=Pseudoluteimonas lycopersici TaxID=1324796 RepID=A0A516V3R8_9GAMM|nr:ribonuclease D [Lysobacter lycopersici]QDQ73179.1 ribonuclease D [Lysobacter lycopersici]